MERERERERERGGQTEREGCEGVGWGGKNQTRDWLPCY